MEDNYKWMVCVQCMTYNQAPYIEDALNGFTMQKTTFPFVCCIVDDASTDGEQEVIVNYLNEHFDLVDNKVARHEETDDYVLTFARHKTNLNCFFAVLYLKYNHYKKKSKTPYLAQWHDNAKYIAMCEGDDYWIIREKLEEQVGYMENHIKCTVCYTNFDIEYMKSGRVIKSAFNSLPSRYKHYKTLDDFILFTPYVCPPSWLYRAEIYNQMNYTGIGVDGSFELFAYLMFKGETHFYSNVTCRYRVVRESASHSLDVNKQITRRKKLLELQHKLIDKYNLNPNLKEKCEERYIHKNLLFFVENNFQDEINKAKRIKTKYSTKEKWLLLVAKNSVLRCLLCFVHRIHNRIKGY